MFSIRLHLLRKRSSLSTLFSLSPSTMPRHALRQQSPTVLETGPKDELNSESFVTDISHLGVE